VNGYWIYVGNDSKKIDFEMLIQMFDRRMVKLFMVDWLQNNIVWLRARGKRKRNKISHKIY